MKKTIAILGATGSVGTQAVSVAKAKGYEVDLLTGDSNVCLMEQLARELKPREVVMANESAALDLPLGIGSAGFLGVFADGALHLVGVNGGQGGSAASEGLQGQMHACGDRAAEK